MPDRDTTAPSAAQKAAADMRRLLADLGADADLLRRIHAWQDLHEGPYVYVPPLPAHLVKELARLVPLELTL